MGKGKCSFENVSTESLISISQVARDCSQGQGQIRPKTNSQATVFPRTIFIKPLGCLKVRGLGIVPLTQVRSTRSRKLRERTELLPEENKKQKQMSLGQSLARSLDSSRQVGEHHRQGTLQPLSCHESLSAGLWPELLLSPVQSH